MVFVSQLMVYLIWTPLVSAYYALNGPCPLTTTVSVNWKIGRTIRGNENFITINDKWPAEPIVINICQALQLTVTNNLPSDLTSLHFHGLLQQYGNTMMDGTQGLTQSGIAPGQSFTYTVFPNQPGTYWIHSHSPGQYPQGLRAPFIVKNPDEPKNYNYSQEETITLTDWWPDFKSAEDRSITTDASRTCGSGSKEGKGIEVPPEAVLMNDVGGHNNGLTENNKVYKFTTCNARMRLRFVNLSSHARFYIQFSDYRPFDVIELDGVNYEPKSVRTLELASGQRASINVGAYDGGGNCASTYIVAVSDYKVSHGTKRCPMSGTDARFPVQYTHGYLEVPGSVLVKYKTLPVGQNFLTSVKVWLSQQDMDDPNWQVLPWNVWNLVPNGWNILKNRIQYEYQMQFFNPNDNVDYGTRQTPSRTGLGVLGIDNGHDLVMKPRSSDAAWIMDRSKVSIGDYMHYITLGSANTSLVPEKGGFATMAENLGDGAGAGKMVPFTSPDTQTGPPDTSKLQVPTLFRILKSDSTDAQLITSAFYDSAVAPVAPGRNIIIPDSRSGQPHWFIVRSQLGDHPMHLHGHHFQILAKIPPQWFLEDRNALYNHVADYRVQTSGKPDLNNPPRRDTVMIEQGFTYVLAIKPDNPGVWAFHCHNDIHAVSGMFSQVIERPLALRALLGTWSLVTTTTWPTTTEPWKPFQVFQNMVWNGKSADDGKSFADKSTTAQWMVQLFNLAIKTYGWDVNSWTPFMASTTVVTSASAKFRRWILEGAFAAST